MNHVEVNFLSYRVHTQTDRQTDTQTDTHEYSIVAVSYNNSNAVFT